MAAYTCVGCGQYAPKANHKCYETDPEIRRKWKAAMIELGVIAISNMVETPETGEEFEA